MDWEHAKREHNPNWGQQKKRKGNKRCGGVVEKGREGEEGGEQEKTKKKLKVKGFKFKVQCSKCKILG